MFEYLWRFFCNINMNFFKMYNTAIMHANSSINFIRTKSEVVCNFYTRSIQACACDIGSYTLMVPVLIELQFFSHLYYCFESRLHFLDYSILFLCKFPCYKCNLAIVAVENGLSVMSGNIILHHGRHFEGSCIRRLRSILQLGI